MLRDVIRGLLQEQQKEKIDEAFYHGTHPGNLKTGQVLKARKNEGSFEDEILYFPRGDIDVESFVERYRPKNMISRKKAIFMTKKVSTIGRAGGDKRCIYKVEPVGEVGRHHFGWFQEILHHADEDIDEEDWPMVMKILVGYAKNYWSGKSKRSGDTWEYLVSAVKVVGISPSSSSSC